MRSDACHRFREVEVGCEFALRILFAATDFSSHLTPPRLRGRPRAVLDSVGPTFGDDVTGALECRFCVGDLARGIDERPQRRFAGLRQSFLAKQDFGQRLQPTFARDGRPRPPFRFERQVQILQPLLVAARFDLLPQRVGQQALLRDRGQHRGFAIG